jgi:hypothetical protein
MHSDIYDESGCVVGWLGEGLGKVFAPAVASVLNPQKPQQVEERTVEPLELTTPARGLWTAKVSP